MVIIEIEQQKRKKACRKKVLQEINFKEMWTVMQICAKRG